MRGRLNGKGGVDCEMVARAELSSGIVHYRAKMGSRRNLQRVELPQTCTLTTSQYTFCNNCTGEAVHPGFVGWHPVVTCTLQIH